MSWTCSPSQRFSHALGDMARQSSGMVMSAAPLSEELVSQPLAAASVSVELEA